MPNDFLFRGDLASLDPDVAALVRHETARQARYLIMIPSESTIPEAVREAVGSAFHNIYAEGYPPSAMRDMTEAEILDYPQRMAEYRRNSDKRYYKGTEYANIVESLARRRVAEVFATEAASADELFVNVQPLSGAPANSAAYTAMLEVGDTVMGLDLLDGGHLTHGSPVNRSGIYYNIVSYGVDPTTEQLDYDNIRGLALAHQPKMIIAGFTSYPLAPDWAKFRAIADEVGAYLLADIAHTAGMAAVGAYPNPVGIADVVNFTTHKTLNGPRGAVSITHRPDVAKMIDKAVFPGEQGGPHVNSIAGLAVAMKFATTQQFYDLQHQTATNAQVLAETLQERGVRLAYGGTDTHMLLADCKSIRGEDDAYLTGDIAARILDLVGIVANRNTIPGDPSAFSASGVRFGTPWITQRGFDADKTRRLGHIIADVFHAITPYWQPSKKKPILRAKIDFDAFQRARNAVRALVDSIGIDTDATADDYPHFYYMEDENAALGWMAVHIQGEHAEAFLDKAVTGQVVGLADGDRAASWLLEADGTPMSRAYVEKTATGYTVHVAEKLQRVTAWLRSLSDGFVLFDPTDLQAKLPGPVVVTIAGASDIDERDEWAAGVGYTQKPYFIGINGQKAALPKVEALPFFQWEEPERDHLMTTPLHGLHQQLKAKLVPFAGYEMPVYYTSVAGEHRAVREHCGVFDVAHMGVFDAAGPGAAAFLDTVFTNDISKMSVGRSQYGFLLDVDGQPLDDLMIYRLATDRFFIVVNAANNDKNWAWLNAVKAGAVALSREHASHSFTAGASVTLRDLRDPAAGADQRVDIALQGPGSRRVIEALGGDVAQVKALGWAEITRATLGGFDLIVSRTGYTGERVAFELFPHPSQAAALFQALVDLGALPCGLAARDSLRTEAGLPLYGHELAGPLGLLPGGAGVGNYARPWKPFFVGKRAYVDCETQRDSVVTRFRLDQKGARPPRQGDPVVDGRGRVVGIVTSCSPDRDGYQVGQVYIKRHTAAEGTPVGVFAGGFKAKPDSGHVRIGDRLPVPQRGTIIRRFPRQRRRPTPTS